VPGFSQRLIETQEAERRRVARELHDEVGQALTAIRLNLLNVQQQAGASPLAQQLNDSLAIVDRALQDVHRLALDLRPAVLDDLGLIAALDWYVDRGARRAGWSTDVVASPLQTRLPPELETACFRIVQEALTNVARHARARHVRVELRVRDTDVQLVIRDDGVGFDVEAVQSRRGPETSLGLQGMHERALIVGGQVEITSAPGQGTVVAARFRLT